MSDNKLTSKIDEKLPISRATMLGIQHTLALYAGAVTVPLIIAGAIGLGPKETAYLVSAGLVTSGIASLIQNFCFGGFIGVRLPIMMGCAFGTLSACMAIGKQSGINVMFGAIIVMGIIMMLAAPVIGQVTRYFPSLVTGSIVTIIGVTLMPNGIISIGGGNPSDPTFGDPINIMLGLIVIAVIVLANRYFTGYMQAIAVLLGLVVGTVVAALMGRVSFAQMESASWIQIVTPFSFGAPKFEIGAIITLGIIGVVQLVESLATFNGVADICETKLNKKQVISGLYGEGFCNIIAGLFNGFPFIAYSQNMGLLSLTKVVSRYATIAAGIVLIVIGSIPKLASLATIVPKPVFGGAMIVMFSMVAMAGINILRDVDFSKSGNMLTASLAIGLGAGAKLVPGIFQHCPPIVETVFGSGIVTGAVIAIICNIIFNGNDIKSERKMELERAMSSSENA